MLPPLTWKLQCSYQLNPRLITVIAHHLFAFLVNFRGWMGVNS